MIYEVRTYTLEPGTMGRFEESIADALPHREMYSPLAAFRHTNIGVLNQVRNVWPYKGMNHRNEARKAAGGAPNQPSGAPGRIRQENKIMVPASFSPMR